MKSKILDSFDFEKANILLERFNKSTGFVTAILDLEGNILSKSGWRQICTDYHRKNPETALNCTYSDTILGNEMLADEKYLFYKCMNGLVDVRVPIVIRGEHIANLFSGQLFFEEPDIAFFKKQAEKYGFEEQAYLEALSKVPVVSKEKVETAMDFLLNITQLIIEMTAEKLEQIELNEALKKSEEALCESQEKLKQNLSDLLESQRIAHLGTWHLDLATDQVMWSEELYKMYGFDPTIPPPPYTEHMKLFTPESWERLSTSLEQTRTFGIPYELELETVTIDGLHGWMWVRGEANKDAKGKIISLWGAAQDITEYKKTELEIKQSEERFQLLFYKAPLGYQSLDFDGCFLDVNQEWLDMLGYRREEVLGKWFGDFLSPAYQEGFRQRFPLFKAQGHIHSEFEMIHKKGNKLFIALDGKIGYDKKGEFKQTHCILKDITIERQLEKDLSESRSLMQSIFNSINEAIYVKDLFGKYLFINHAEELMLGKSAAEVLGKDDYNLFPADEASLYIQRDHKVLKEEKITTYEGKLTNLFGMTTAFINTKGPLYDINKKLIGLFGVQRDVSEIKQAEDKLRESEEKYRNIFTVESDALFIIDIETGAIIDANNAACELYGYAYEEILQLKNTDMSAEPKQTKQATQDLQEGQALIPLRWHKKKDGTVFPVEIMAKLFLLENRKVHIIAIRDITEREIAEEKLKTSEANLKQQNELFSSLLKIIPVGVFMVEAPSGKPILVNEAAKQILGRGILPDTSTENLSVVYKAYKLDSEEHYPPEEMPILLGMKGISAHVDDMQIKRPDGTKTAIEIFGSPVFDEHGEIKASIVSFLDITERKQAEKALRLSEEKYKLLYTSMDQGAALHEIITDAAGKPIDYIFIDINDSYTRLFGLTRDAIGKKITEVMPEVEQYWIDVFGKVALTGEPAYYENYLTTTGRYYSTYSYCPKKNQFAVLVSDITDRIKKSDEILYLSYHDQLTGLYNRRFYEEELKRLDTERNLPLTIAMGDVNGLKLVNDSFGHILGDELLQKVAEILKLGCRADDIIARLGGDEFVIILPNTDVVEAEQVINRINELLAKEKVGNLEISISFGYEAKTKKQEDLEEVFKAAENHMYRHKLHASSSMRSKTVDLIMSTLYEKNHREMLHSQRVSKLCVALAQGLKLDKEETNQIRIAGLMHDIGKIGIAERILNSNIKLNQDEINEIRRHPEIGYRILSSVNEFSEIATFVLEHQERWDGTGYPKGLQATEISLSARIITIADAFDAMTGERTYGKSLDRLAAIAEIKRCAGTQFDPALVKVFIEEVFEKGADGVFKSS